MLLEFLLEERSAEVALQNIVHRILPYAPLDTRFHPFRGKQDLLSKLPLLLKGYRKWIASDHLIVILVDRDTSDCYELKQRLEAIVAEAGFKTISRSPDDFQVIIRVVVEELEAWFFGDWEAVCKAYGRVPRNLDKKAKFRDPDAIRGGTWEQLQRILQDSGDHPRRLNKTRAASDISRHMDPDRNRSKSFQVFRDALRRIPQRYSDK